MSKLDSVHKLNSARFLFLFRSFSLSLKSQIASRKLSSIVVYCRQCRTDWRISDRGFAVSNIVLACTPRAVCSLRLAHFNTTGKQNRGERPTKENNTMTITKEFNSNKSSTNYCIYILFFKQVFSF